MRSKGTHPNADAFPPGLSGPALRALAHAGIHSMAQLARWTAADLAALHGIGPAGVRVLQQALVAPGARRSSPKPSVDGYLAALPTEQRRALNRLRTQLRALIPDVVETIKTSVPALQYRGKTVVGFGAGKTHLGLYVMHGETLARLGAELAGCDASNRVVRFTPQTPLPATLVRKIVRHRVEEIDAQLERSARSQ